MANSQNGDIAGQMLRSLAEAQIELDTLRRELEESHRLVLVGTMAAGLAHEINNLLTPVMAHAQLSAGRPGDLEYQAKTLNKVMRGVKDAAVLTRTILGLAGNRPDSASGPKSPRADVRNAAESALACLVRQPSKDGIEVSNRIRPDLEVDMEPILLQQVILNLILNAQRAMSRRGGSITLDAREDDGESVQIEVSDTGPGIPTAMIDRLFEPFARRRSKRQRPNAAQNAFHPAKTGVESHSGSAESAKLNINQNDPNVSYDDLDLSSEDRHGRRDSDSTSRDRERPSDASIAARAMRDGGFSIMSADHQVDRDDRPGSGRGRADTSSSIKGGDSASAASDDPAKCGKTASSSGRGTSAKTSTYDHPSAAIDAEADPGGAGLGLATCRLLIEHAGGSIAVRSAPGHGATFTLTLPRSTPAHPRRAAG